MNLIIISAGKLGREVSSWAHQVAIRSSALRIKGFLDDRSGILNGFSRPSLPKVLGGVEDYNIASDDVFVCAIGDPRAKQKYCTPILNRGGRFINLIHPLANVGEGVELGTGIILAPFTSITADAKVGNFVSVMPFSNIAHDASVGDWSLICGHSGVNGNVKVREGVFLGSHSCLIPGVTVGAWAFVGAGSVVLRDVPPGIRVAGNPARPLLGHSLSTQL